MIATREAKTAAASNRDIRNFFGDSLVVGCGEMSNAKFLRAYSDFFGDAYHQLHSNKDYFYSIDIAEEVNPDLQCDIRDCPESLNKRFDFIFLEYLSGFVYLDSVTGDFSNKRIEEILFDFGILFIAGYLPKHKRQQIDGQIYEASTEEAVLIVKGPATLDPALVIRSLDEDAQKLLSKYKLSGAESKHDSYDQKVNQDFIKIKVLQIIDREIDRLSLARNKMMHGGIGLFKSKKLAIKDGKILGLNKLKIQISLHYPVQTLAKMIEESCANHPALLSGTVKHLTKDKLQRITEMENYHLTRCNQLDKKTPRLPA